MLAGVFARLHPLTNIDLVLAGLPQAFCFTDGSPQMCEKWRTLSEGVGLRSFTLVAPIAALHGWGSAFTVSKAMLNIPVAGGSALDYFVSQRPSRASTFAMHLSVAGID
jgi:hypothetical protein